MTKPKAIKISPLADLVLIEPMEAEEVTAGGIVLPGAAQEKPQQGKVMAVGPGRMLDSGERAGMTLKVGDIVLLPKYGGDTVTIDGVENRMVRESDILAVLE